MNRILILIIALTSSLFVNKGLAQDHIYSQFYNMPQYLNPALNGQFDGDFRMNLIYRNQWTNITGSLAYYSFSADINIPQFGGGLGIIVNKSSEGTAYLDKLNFAGIYSYSVEFGNSGVLSFGIQAGVTNRKIDFNKLVFYDQLDDNGIIPGVGSAANPPDFNHKFFFDSGAGVNVVLGNFMIGGAAHHINKPNESLTGAKSILPIRYTGHLSYKLALDPFDDEDSPFIIPSIIYYNQAKVQSVSAGFQLKRKSVNLGLWYRGESKQRDAIVVSLILDLFVHRDSYNKIRFGVSHDATTSKLKYGNTAGATELALSYETSFSDGYNSGGGTRYYRNDAKRCYDFY